MNIELSRIELDKLLQRSAEIGANRVLVEMGIKSNKISQNRAFARFGQGNIRRWREDGRITPVKQGGKIFYDIERLETLNQLNDLI